MFDMAALTDEPVNNYSVRSQQEMTLWAGRKANTYKVKGRHREVARKSVDSWAGTTENQKHATKSTPSIAVFL